MSAKPFTYGVETIPWEEAARALQREGVKNRPITMRRVDTIARAVESRRFYLTHQGIAFDPAGNLIDGQHRLMAHVRTKTDYVGLVCRYTDAAYAARVMAIFDSGRSRNTADGLAIGGIMKTEEAKDATAVANVLRMLIANDKSRAPDLQETGDFFELHKAAIRWAVATIPKKRGSAVTRAAFAVAWEAYPEKTAEFAAQMKEGVATPGSAAALWNRAVADGLLSADGGTGARRDVALRALRILRAHVTGETPPERLYTTEEALSWFLKDKAPVPSEVNPMARMNHLEKDILAAIPKGGARLGDIARKVKRHPSAVRHNLVRMESIGVVKRPEVGFYVPIAA